ncbi:hypothetical protein GCM10010129_01260 [Streptomyces fumigatiscleroticus]|nr:hypothetical protein GCM10010129_01260 [Streptomyces fumigatiscleroticus]
MGATTLSLSSDLRPRPPLPGAVPQASRVLLAAASALLAAVAVIDLFAVYAGARIHALIDGDEGFATAAQPDLDAARSLYEAAERYRVIVYLPCAILFVVWFARMRRGTGPLAPDRFRDGPGWAVGSWLVPLANVLLPYRVAVDMWGAATPAAAGGKPYRVPFWPVYLWWGLYVSSALYGGWYARSRYDDARTLAQVRDAAVHTMASGVLEVAAAAAAVHFAVRLTAMQRRKASEEPYRTGPLPTTG